MAVFIPTKHVTAPLDERVRALLRGEFSYASSGSDHDGTASASDDPSCFSSLLNYFIDSSDSSPSNQTNDSDEEADSSSIPNPSKSTAALAVPGHLRHLLSPPPHLVSEVRSAAEIAAAIRPTGSILRRSVMGRLRERGFNAGICKARWGGSHGLTAGSYEYIDVVVPADGEGDEIRYIVDLGFAAEFVVARATEEYERAAAALPEVMVARPEAVKAAVIVMAKAVSRSFKSRGMSVPPWRKKRYMMAKWLGFYRRTVNSLPVEGEGGPEGGVTCRLLGFRCGGEN